MTIELNLKEHHEVRFCIETRIDRVNDMIQLPLEDEQLREYNSELEDLLMLRKKFE